MTLSKDRLRKIHNIPEQSGPEDPTVVARRHTHKAIAMWCDKWLTPLQILFASIGGFVILLPIFIATWRDVIEETPLLLKIFHDYSSLTGLALYHLFILFTVHLIRLPVINKIPGGGGPTFSYKSTIVMELYPRTKAEEFAYSINAAFSALSTSIWMFLPFGLFAYFMTIGG